ncbi:MAG: hypothetical protein ABIG10_02610 [bacterium]
MISDLIRILVFLCDWRSLLRIITFKPRADIIFISNIRSSIDRKRITGIFNSAADHFGLVRIRLGNVLGQIRIINSTYEEILSKDGFKKAKRQTLEVIKWGIKKGVRVVLFASSTKRLFGSDGQELKEMFPDILFTIGDNGTAMILRDEIKSIFSKVGFNKYNCRVGILGAYGFIGEAMIDFFKNSGYDIVGMGTSEVRLKRLGKKYNIQINTSIKDMGKLDVVVACTHINGSRLKADNIDYIRKDNRKILVFDMAQPPNLSEEEYKEVKDKVIRLDSADAYSKNLKYVLGYIGYHATGVPRRVTFGCFAEGIVLASLLKAGLEEKKIFSIDHFQINEDNIKIMRDLYDLSSAKFQHQQPRTYSKAVPSLNLDI